MSKNVAVFVDVANIFYAAKAAGVDIDYVTLLKASSAGRDLVRAYAYTGLDPENENQRNFHEFLRRHGYKVVSKDIRKYGDGKVKANLDIELVVDMMKTARNLDVAIVVSGDGDFAPAIRAVQEMGVRVEVVSFRGNTSSDLIDVADIFTDITQIAKVEKGSSRSGRRVATDDEDLSMTEVPDKMTEGTGDGRRRGRGSRSRTGEAAATGTARPRTAARAASTRAPSARTLAARAAAAQDAVVLEGTLVALPGEKLSRARRAPAPEPVEGVELDELPVSDAIEPIDAGESEIDVEGAEGVGGDVAADADGQPGDGQHRRRRRRGGRGRGRGHGREGQGVPVEGTPDGDVEEFEEPEPLPAPRRPAFSFGSVWDSQLGKAPPAAAPGSGTTSIPDEEDLEEPSIPEYLLAERRNRDAGRNRPGRGGVGSRRGGAYAAALDRERFGGGRGSTQSRFAEPAQRHRDIGAGRSDPGRRPPGRGYERPEPRSSGGEPWSEVPPEIEAMLRAQLAGSGRAARPVAGGERRPPITAGAGEAPAAQAGPAAPVAGPRPTARTRVPARGRRATVAAPLADANAAATGAVVSDEAATDTAASKAAASPPARPASRARRAPKAAPVATADRATAEAAGPPATSPRRGRSAGRTAAVEPGSDAATGAAGGEAEASAPKRRITRRKTTAAD